jgi:hypothetical protein
MVPDDYIRLTRIGNVLIDAALANRDIKAHLADPRPPKLWTIEGVRRNPICRVEWEHAVVIGGIGESLAAARHKYWGPFIGVLPLAPTDPVHWSRILYLYKASSPYNRRVEQRHALKRILGRQHRPLVTLASRSTKRDFLASLSELGAHVIKRRLSLEPSQFWRAAKGHDFLDLPKPPVQLLLFSHDGDDDVQSCLNRESFCRQ